jgi:DNA-binding PadR family transcriptional regulator
MITEPEIELPSTALALLGLLSFQPMSGYDLKQFADASISHFYWSPAKSQIYAELRRLKAAGLVTEQHVEQQNRPDKRVYSMTQAGLVRLTEWLNSTEFEPHVDKRPTLLRLFLGKHADPEALIRLLEQDRQSSLAQREQLIEAQKECEAVGAVFPLMTIRCGLTHIQADLDWIDETVESLRNLAAQDDAVDPGVDGK